MSKKIYFAAPLHDPEDQRRNTHIVTVLREDKHEIYLPQEYGKWEDLLTMFGGDATKTRQYLFMMDCHAIQQAQCVVAYVAREKGPSEGMLWEMGYAAGLGKPVFLLNPMRRWRYNLMPEFGSLMFESLEGLVDHLRKEDFR